MSALFASDSYALFSSDHLNGQYFDEIYLSGPSRQDR